MKIQTLNRIEFKQKTKAFHNVSDSLLFPRIIKLNKNLYVAAFSIMKLLPAKHIIHEAINRGDINENSTIVATSSGTYALGIATTCAELNLPFTIFGDTAIDKFLLDRLADLGGSIHISKNPKTPGAYQELRLAALKNYISEDKLRFWTKQYDNLDNRKAYSVVAEQILNTLGKNINIVGPVGSGGSTCGVALGLREVNPEIELIGVDTFNSVLFGQPDGARLLRGLGNSIIPKNLEHSLYDEIHWVSANEAHYHTRWLHQKKALFCGPTSGAAYQVAKHLSLKHPEKDFLFIAPDEGHRYLATTYNDEWLSKQPFYSKNIHNKPRKISHPLEAIGPWSYMKWNRRNYCEVISHEK